MFADADLGSQAAPTTPSRDRGSVQAQDRLLTRTRHALTPTDRGAALVVLGHLLPVWWLISGGGLYLDDLRAQAYARNQPFWPFIVSSNGTHLAPGARTLDWLQTNYAPLEHWPALVVTLGTHLLLGVVTWAVLRELAGPRLMALVPLAIALLTPAIVSATAWYRQTLTTLLPLVFVLAATYCATRLLRSASYRWAAAASGLIVVALLFSERAIAGCALVVAVALIVPVEPDTRRMPRVVALTVPLLAIAAAYVAVYRSGPFDQGSSGGLSPSDYLNLLWHSIALGIVPALFGGPWRWAPSGPSLSVASTPLVPGVICCLVLLAALVIAARRPGAWSRVAGALCVAASYVVPIELFVFVGRYAGFHSATGADLRLYADCAVVVTIWLGIALLGWRDPEQVRAGSPLRPSTARRAVAALALAVVAIGTAVSWGGFGQRWHENATPAYLATLRADLAKANRFGATRTMTVVPGLVPDAVIPAWMQTQISSLDIVALLSPHTELALDAASVQTVGLDGRLVPGHLRTVQVFDTGANNFCHHPLQPNAKQPAVIRSPEVVSYKRDELIELGMLVNDERTVDVEVVGDDGHVSQLAWPWPTKLQRGPYVARLRVPYGVNVAAVRVMPATAGMCIVSVKAVAPVEPQ